MEDHTLTRGALGRVPGTWSAARDAARDRDTTASRAASNRWSTVLVALTVAAAAAVVSLVGADARWLAALGAVIARHGTIPAGVPFASAPTAHWPNTIVLAELIFHGLQSALGIRGLMLAQLVAVAVGTGAMMQDAIAGGARRQAATAATLIACLAAMESLAVARAQLFSLALFPLLVALLRSDARDPSRRIWLVVPLLALWSNLHGAVLIGLAVTGIYLAFVRLRSQPRLAIAVGAAAVAAICVTPAGLRTAAYYHGVLTNEAARQGQGLWAPLSLSAPLDILLAGGATALAVRLRPRAISLWQLLVTLLLVVMTVQAARSGVWLVFFLVAPAARRFKPRAAWDRVLPPLAAVALLVLIAAIARGPLASGAGPALVSRAVALAHGTPILAEDLQAEQIVLAGGRVWVSDPIDAFPDRVQSAYLAWSSGRPSGARVLTPQIHVVVAARGSAAQRLMARAPAYRPAESDGNSEIYLRRVSSGGGRGDFSWS